MAVQEMALLGKQFSLARRGTRRYNRGIVRWTFIWLAIALSAVPARAGSDVPSPLEVRSDPAGGVRATATVLFPARREILQSILTDYANWPELFEVRMRVASLDLQGDRAVTDLRIEHALLPGERRLLCESRALLGGGLVTELKGGDFKRYRRIWKLSAVGDGNQTRADFELVVEIDSIIPDWLVALAMRRELEAHFRIVTDKAVERAKRGK